LNKFAKANNTSIKLNAQQV